MREILKNKLEGLKTHEGRLRFLKTEIESYPAEDINQVTDIIHEVVEKVSEERASRYANGDPEHEAGKIYQDLELYEYSLEAFKKANNPLSAAEVALKLNKTKEAQKLFLKSANKSIKIRKEHEKKGSAYLSSWEEDYLKFADKAKEFGLESKRKEYLLEAARREVNINPSHVLKYINSEQGPEFNKVRGEATNNLIKEKEKTGDFKDIAELYREMGPEFEQQAEFYDSLLEK